jgi:hypothetical protein
LARFTRLQDKPPPETPLNQVGPGLGPSEERKATTRSSDCVVWSTGALIDALGTSWSALTLASTDTAGGGGPLHVGSAPESTGTPTAVAMKVLTKRDRFERRMEGFTFHRMRAGLRLIKWG